MEAVVVCVAVLLGEDNQDPFVSDSGWRLEIVVVLFCCSVPLRMGSFENLF